VGKLEYHSIADIFPLIEGERFGSLVADVKEHGVLEPIWLYEGQILDGRNRYRAAQEAGRDFETKTFPDDAPHDLKNDPVAFVLSLNLDRRQLGKSQLAFVALEIEGVEAKLAKDRMSQGGGDKRSGTQQIGYPIEDKGEAAKKAAARVGVNHQYVSDAKWIKKIAPELAADIKAGRKTITQAKREIKEAQKKKDLQRHVDVSLVPGLHHGDFRALSDKIEDNSVDLVFTDPPYDRKSVPLYGDAARVAARILKPGGSFIAYCGQYCLPEVLGECGQYLRYWWTIAGVHGGAKGMMEKYGIRVGWKPLVWFVKEDRGDICNVISDIVTGKREKDYHEWQQSEQEAAYYIKNLASNDGLVVDFFVGGGTTGVAAKKLGRRFIGFEVDATHAERASKRILGVA
jgi:hypothetical protein